MVRAPTTDKVASLIKLYKGTTEFTGLSSRTQADYLKQIKKIETKFGKMALVALESPKARGAIQGMARFAGQKIVATRIRGRKSDPCNYQRPPGRLAAKAVPKNLKAP